MFATKVFEFQEHLQTNSLTAIMVVDDDSHSCTTMIGVKIEEVDTTDGKMFAKYIFLQFTSLIALDNLLFLDHESQLTTTVDVGTTVFLDKLAQSLARKGLVRRAVDPNLWVVLPTEDGVDVLRLHSSEEDAVICKFGH